MGGIALKDQAGLIFINGSRKGAGLPGGGRTRAQRMTQVSFTVASYKPVLNRRHIGHDMDIVTF